jgi:hypothetical protein
MTGKSFLDVLKSEGSGVIDPSRHHIFFGKNSHTETAPQVQNYLNQNGHFYAPQRSILSDEYILVWNLVPDEWPNGPTPAYPDVDTWGLTGGGETKGYMLDHKDDAGMETMIAMSFLKRPRYELYNMKSDPWHLQNLAADVAFAEVLQQYKIGLEQYMCDTKDPEAVVDTLGNLNCDTVGTGTFNPVKTIKIQSSKRITSPKIIHVSAHQQLNVKLEQGSWIISIYSLKGVLEFKSQVNFTKQGIYRVPEQLRHGVKLLVKIPVLQL